MAWRYLLQRMNGDGTQGEFIHTELPLSDVSLTSNLSATDELTATCSPALAAMKDSAGNPIFTEYGTAIWAEDDGDIKGGGIVVHSSAAGPKWSLQCTGLHGYAYGMPYTDSWFGVEIDPFDVYREVWRHLQAKEGGNLGLSIPQTIKTGLKIGVELEQAEFDTQSGPISFEAGPVKLNWYDTHDLGNFIADLVKSTPFDYRENHAWSGSDIVHWMELGYPRLGRRLEEMRFVVGENIFVPIDVDRDGTAYASEVMLLGAGSGRTMIRGYAAQNTGKLRRVRVLEDKAVKSVTKANTLAAFDLKASLITNDITSVQVADHPHARIAGIRPGDEIRLQTDGEWQDLDVWCRVLSKTITPDASDTATLGLILSDKVG